MRLLLERWDDRVADKVGAVKMMFELYATGEYSLRAIANELNDVGFRSRFGKRLSATQVDNALKNRFYYGLMKIRGQLHKHKYESIIEEELFMKVTI